MEALYGKGDTDRIVALGMDGDGMSRWRRRGDGSVTRDRVEHYPAFWFSDPTWAERKKRDIRGETQLHKLKGDLHFNHLLLLEDMGTFWDVYREVKQHAAADERLPQWAHTIVDQRQMYMVQSGETQFGGMEPGDVHFLSFDIEVYSENGMADPSRRADETIIIAMKDNRGNECLLHQGESVEMRGVDTCSFVSEKALLRGFVKSVQKLDPDVLCGHNVHDFDLNYLDERCSLHDLRFAIGRRNRNGRHQTPRSYSNRKRAANRYIEYPRYQVFGRHVYDTMFASYDWNVISRELDSFGLKDIAQQIGVAPDDRTYVEGSEIAGMWKRDPRKLLSYAVDDVRETEGVRKYMYATDFYQAQIMPLSFEDFTQVGTGAQVENMMIREYLRQLHSIPKGADKADYDGAFTKLFRRGVFGAKEGEVIENQDVSSLYPACQMKWDRYPESDVLGVMPTLLESLTEMRLETKYEMRELPDGDPKKSKLNARQNTYKIGINCFTPDTEVVTVGGIKKIGEVEEGEMVYSINPDTQEVDLKPVVETYRQERYTGEMVQIKSSYVDFVTTPNHRFLVQSYNNNEGEYSDFEWMEAGEIEDSYYQRRLPGRGKFPGVDDAEFVQVSDLCEKHGIGYELDGDKIHNPDVHRGSNGKRQPNRFGVENWFRLMGWFIAEGHVYTSERKEYDNGNIRGRSMKIMISQKRKEDRIKIRSLLEEMEISFGANQQGFWFMCEPFARVLIAECGEGSANKQIPGWMLKFPPSKLEHLYETLMLGDGDKMHDRYSTKSDKLAKQFVRLAFQIGLFPHMGEEDSGCHRIWITEDRTTGPTIQSGDRMTSRVEYDGPIECIEVADNHTILAGRNGTFNWTGQSFYGYCGYKYGLWNDMEAANDIVRDGEKVLRTMNTLIQEQGHDLVESDTDGTWYIPNGHGPDGEELAELLTDRLPEGIEIDLDASLPGFASYKTKNYVKQKEGGKIETVGSALTSSSFESFGRDFVRQGFKLLLDGQIQEMHDLYVEVVNRLRNRNVRVEDLVKRESLKEEMETYERKVESDEHGRHRGARYELARRHDHISESVGTTVTYYVAEPDEGEKAVHNVRVYEDAKPVEFYEGDENRLYYIRNRMRSFAQKFTAFFTEGDHAELFPRPDAREMTVEHKDVSHIFPVQRVVNEPEEFYADFMDTDEQKRVD
jgi:DNA polymerase elongation subunit (family B)